mgnify:CR=1 FL=1
MTAQNVQTCQQLVRIDQSEASKFYVSLYFETLKRIDRINDIKVSLLKLSLASTFIFFSWILAHVDDLLHIPLNFRLAICFIPSIFNIFGLIYNCYLKATADKYGRFTRYLLTRIDNLENLYDDFLSKENSKKLNLSLVFWSINSLISIGLAFWIYNASTSPSDCEY